MFSDKGNLVNDIDNCLIYGQKWYKGGDNPKEKGLEFSISFTTDKSLPILPFQKIYISAVTENNETYNGNAITTGYSVCGNSAYIKAKMRYYDLPWKSAFIVYNKKKEFQCHADVNNSGCFEITIYTKNVQQQ